MKPELLELIREMRAGLACLPEGPWHFNPDNVGATPHHGYGLLSGDGTIGYGSDSLPIHIEASMATESKWGKGVPDKIAAHIARCFPENIAKLLDAAEAALQQPGGWQPIETAPKHQDILVGGWDLHGRWCACVYRITNDHWREEWEFKSDEPTMWQPLATPPHSGSSSQTTGDRK